MKNFIYLILINLFTTCLLSQNSDWVYRNPLPQNDFYAIKFFNQNTGIVCGSNGIILKTVSGDNNWINLSIDGSLDLYGMYFTDVNRGIIVGENGLIIKTGNGGITWQKMVSPTANTLRSITFVDLFYGFAVGDNGIIIKSTNGGDHWSVNYSAPRNLHSVYFIDANTGFAVGDSGLIMKTTNSVDTWNAQTIGTMNLTSIWFTNALTGYMTAEFSAPLKTTDGGLTWNTMYMDYMNGHTYCVKFIDQNTGFIVGHYIPICKTTNAGLNWLEWNSTDLFSKNTIYDISFSDTFLFFSGAKGNILKKSGISATKYMGGSKDNFASMYFLDGNTGFAVGNNKFLRTTNGGLNWNINLIGSYSWFEGNTSYPVKVHFFSSVSGYRVLHDYAPGHWYFLETLQKSSDAGLTWFPSFGPTEGYISAINEIGDITYIATSTGIYKNNGSGWALLYNPGVYFPGMSFANQNTGVAIFNVPHTGFFRTTDGGDNWSLTPSTNTNNMSGIQLFSSGVGYIAGDSSLFEQTTDFGNTWNQIPNTLNSRISKIQFLDENTGWLIARNVGYSYINKLYYTSNGGINLVQITSLDSFNVEDISFINALTGFISGDSGVVLKTTNGGLSFVSPISYNVPDKFSLYQNYPNPFNPVTRIKFDITKREAVKLKIFDLLGREMKTLVNEQLQPGTYEAEWDGTNYASGIYFYKLITADYSETRKMILIK